MRARVARFTAAFQALLLMATLVLPALAAATEITTDLWIYNDGDTVTVTGIDFGANEVVDFVTTDPVGTVVDTGSATSDENGGVVYAFILHATVPGIYDVVATGQTSGLTASTQFDPPATIVFTFPAAVTYNAAAWNVGCSTAGGDACGTAEDGLAAAQNLTAIRFSLRQGSGNYWNGSSFSSGSEVLLAVSSVSPSLPSNAVVSWSITFPAANFPAAGAYTLKIETTQSASPVTATSSVTFTFDNTPPVAPSVTASSPSSPANDNNPEISGSAEAGSTVRLYTNATCTSAIAQTGTASAFNGGGLTVTVANNSTTTYYATATDAAGNVSPCSATSVTYVEDSSAPAAPVITGSTPASPSQNTGPTIDGTSEAGTTVRIYKQNDCGGGVEGTGSASPAFSIAVSVGNNSTTTFYARATDAAGNVSPCSTTFVTYNADNNGPTATILTNPTNPTTSTTAGFTFSVVDTGGNASGLALIQCQLDGGGWSTCSSPFSQVVAPGAHTFEVRGVDNAGNVGDPDSYSWTVNPSDTTPPDTTIDSNPADPTNSSSATFTFSGTDAGSGVASFECQLDGSGFSACTSPATYTGLGDGSHTFEVRAIDGVALVDPTPASFTWTIDTIAPVITGLATPGANANGWNNTDVVVSFTCSAGGGTAIATDTVAGDTLTAEGAGQSVTSTGDCIDNAGNAATAATVLGINIDKTAPDVALVGGPADGGTYYFGFVPAAPTCSASDALSGLDGTCSVTGYSTAVGTHTVTASATDKAGNSASDSHTYTVLAWTLNGFYSPVDMGGVVNTVKAGSTVPLKFEVFAGSTELTLVSYIQGFEATEVTCGLFSLMTADAIEITSTGNTTLRYDSTGGQFIQNWQTSKQKAGKCYVVTMTTDDGTSLNAFFQLK